MTDLPSPVEDSPTTAELALADRISVSGLVFGVQCDPVIIKASVVERDLIVSALRSTRRDAEAGEMREAKLLPDWMAALSMQQQSVLVLGLRGPDGVRKYHPCKDIVRFYRGTVLKAARFGRLLEIDEKADTFMCMEGFSDEGAFRQKIKAYFDTIDELPHHYHMHLMHGAQILGYKHPDELYRNRWMSFYLRCLDDSHTPQGETEQQMDARLGDWGRKQWNRAALAPASANEVKSSAPASSGSLPSGESDPTVTLGLAGADPAHRSSPAGSESSFSAENAWHELVEKDDRTSPEEYPDMCLISFEELRDFMQREKPKDALDPADVIYYEGYEQARTDLSQPGVCGAGIAAKPTRDDIGRIIRCTVYRDGNAVVGFSGELDAADAILACFILTEQPSDQEGRK